MDDLRSKVKQDKSLLEKIMFFIPLYHGYKEKELRRESDRLLRSYIYQILTDSKNSLKKSQQHFIDANKMELAKKIDKLIVSCDTVSQKINHAESGYSGFWDAVKVKEKGLDTIYEIDSKIASIAIETKKLSTELILQSISNDNIRMVKSTIGTITEKIEALDNEINDRRNFLHGYGNLDG